MSLKKGAGSSQLYHRAQRTNTRGSYYVQPKQPSEFNAGGRIFWTRSSVGGDLAGRGANKEFKLWMNLPRGNGANNLILLLEIKEKMQIPADQAPSLGATTFEPLPLSVHEMEHIMAQPEYQEYFSTVFAQELITLLPILGEFLSHKRTLWRH